ncbi:helix-turn-helix domain-containing protein [Nakamurella flavida]|uniref:Helix-turn-helix domain-containing protein n=1 Tax=Nakamurella flavida TaxID=363630 RepID=A0A938YLI0_9ACTN|nr:helix-turn-helix domain-containing protein [Nakamurella flavida]MBM9476741.1 helix-turn-helix domain-containing protein [Nakamurella flavida]MDP9778821.1 transcriptional regulator with XRE-family HTH domain [Nakamurella flavida]
MSASAPLGRPVQPPGLRLVTPLGGSPVTPSLAELLRTHRTRIGLTQQQLADFSTVSVRAIRDMENGVTLCPRRETVQLLARSLRLDDAAREDLSLAAGVAAPAAPTGPGVGVVRAGALLGRDRERAELADWFSRGAEPVLTVVGLPGVGKTRLVLELAGAVGHDGSRVLWPGWGGDDGGGADLPDRLVEAAVAELTTAAGGRGAASTRLALRIGAQPALLVLDDPARPPDPRALDQLLGQCPGLRVVLTAVRPPRVTGMRRLVLHGLPTPPDPQDPGWATAPAVRLLTGGPIPGSDPDPGELTPAERADLNAVVEQLDGLPFALTLAAPLVELYGPATLRRCLAEDLLGTLGVGAGAAGSDGTAGAERFRRIRETVDALPATRRRALADLCAVTGPGAPTQDGPVPPTVEMLCRTSGLALPECGRTVDELCAAGLLRRQGPGRFRVVGLVRSLATALPDPTGRPAAVPA